MNNKNVILRLFLAGLFCCGIIDSSAEYSDFYKVYYNGEEIENGATIICNDAYEMEYEDQVVLIYQADINVVNQLPTSNLNRATIEYTDQPTYEEWKADKDAWGEVRLCYHGGDANGEMASCMGTGGIVRIPSSAMDCFNWEVHLEYVPVDVVSVYRLKLRSAQGELQWDDYEYDEDSEFYVDILFEKDNAAVEEITKEKGEPIYYNLSGAKLSNPGKGIFVVKTGNETKKVVIK